MDARVFQRSSTLTRAICWRGGRRHPWLSQRNFQLSSQTKATPSAVRIIEVGPRDGLQNINSTISTPTKIELINRLAAAGLTNIEATSFVSPKWIPQLADGAEVMSQILPLIQQQHMRFPVLVPNAKGLERAIASQAKEVVVFASASEGFSQKNTNCTVYEALQRAREVTEKALSHGILVRGVVSCIFVCPYDGPTPPEKVMGVVRSLLDMGCYEVSLGDTLGVGTPREVERLLQYLFENQVPAELLAGHFHDTYGQAVANVVKAYDMGLRTFDSSVAGLGGCPYAKGAKGNLATEDIAYTFERSNVPTGIDLEKLVLVGDWISREIGQPNGSRAGAALFAKQESKAEASAPAQSTSPTSSREWKKVEGTGEYSVSHAGNIVKITLTRPRNGNALTNSMVEGLTRLYRNLAHDSSVFHIILDSEGKFFCTGMDLSSSGSAGTAEEYERFVELFSAIEHAPQTTVAVIDGPCFAGGVGLAFACDIRLVSERSRFTLTEVKLGLSPAIISRVLLKEWPVPFLREAMITGREVTPTELRQVGAIHGLAKDRNALDQLTEEYLDKLSRCAPRAAASCKELLRLGWAGPGGEKQDSMIRKTYAEMLAPGSEGRHGIEQFRRKVRGVDWGQFWAERRAKL